MGFHNDFDISELHLTGVETISQHSFTLIVWNDDINSFDWVIESLIEVCQHSTEQAEQCALLIHFQGKYAVKQGSFETLKLMRDAITERGINATIEEIANK